MSGAMLFLIAVIVTPIFLILKTYGSFSNAKKKWAEKKGKNIKAGIVMFSGLGVIAAFIVAAVLFSSSAESKELKGSWFKYGELYLGIDNTFHQSPMCKPDETNERITSSGGFIFNIYQSHDKYFEWYFKTQHHSCAFNQDDLKYDSVGFGFNLLLFGER